MAIKEKYYIQLSGCEVNSMRINVERGTPYTYSAAPYELCQAFWNAVDNGGTPVVKIERVQTFEVEDQEIMP